MSDNSPSTREKASKIPSWIMVGFVFGALAAWSFNEYLPQKIPGAGAPPAATGTTPNSAPGTSDSLTPAPAPDPAALAAAAQAAPLSHDNKHLSLYAIDAIFRQWAVNALWDYNTTEAVLWNPADGQYSTFVEVTRRGPDENPEYYYRLIGKPTRPVIHESSRPNAAILFTENEETTAQRKEKERERWLR